MTKEELSFCSMAAFLQAILEVVSCSNEHFILGRNVWLKMAKGASEAAPNFPLKSSQKTESRR